MDFLIEMSHIHWYILTAIFYLSCYVAITLIGKYRYPHLQIAPEKRKAVKISSMQNTVFHLAIWGLISLSMYLGFYLFRQDFNFFYLQQPDNFQAILWIVLEVFVILFITDTNFYWVHRFIHEKPKLYRKLHLDHHVANYPKVWITLYQSPIEQLLTTTLPNAVILLLPINLWSFVIAAVIKHFADCAGHAGFEITPKPETLVTPNGIFHGLDRHRRWIAKLFTTVTHHDMHHQKVKGNYALYFTFWDRVCKTEVKGTEKVYQQLLR